jgi:hypothetical protein
MGDEVGLSEERRVFSNEEFDGLRVSTREVWLMKWRKLRMDAHVARKWIYNLDRRRETDDAEEEVKG